MPGFIRALFEYLFRVTPQWSEKDKLGTVCFDELYIDMDCEIDLKLDMAINPTNKKDCFVMMSALRLLSVHTGQAFKKYFPRDKGKQALGDLIICVAKAYKIMTSRCMLNKKDNWKSALRMHYNKQFGILNQLHTLMRKIKFSSPQIYFQTGIIRTIQSILALHDHMKWKLNLPYLMTSHCDQNYTEAFNGQIRLGNGSGVRNPTSLTLNYRIAKKLACSIIEDESFYIFDLEEILQQDLDLHKFTALSKQVPGVRLLRSLKESQADGMYWAAGYVALRMKNIQILGAYESDATNDHAKNTFTKLMNMGGLTLPLKTWLRDYHQMESWFQAWHPKGSVRPGRGLTVFPHIVSALE